VLKLKCDDLLSTFGFKFNLRRYNVATDVEDMLEKIATRERFINNQLEPLAQEYQAGAYTRPLFSST
jgi:hypothetical protein